MSQSPYIDDLSYCVVPIRVLHEVNRMGLDLFHQLVYLLWILGYLYNFLYNAEAIRVLRKINELIVDLFKNEGSLHLGEAAHHFLDYVGALGVLNWVKEEITFES